MTPEQAQRQIARLPGEFDRVIVNAFRRGVRRIRAAALERLTSRGVGRAFWGKRPKGARSMVKPGRIVSRHGGVSTEFTVQGMAALQEQGGRTEPHLIEAQQTRRARLAEKYAGRRRGEMFAQLAGLKSNRKVLAMKIGGGVVFRPRANHRGSRIKRIPFMEPSIESETPALNREIEQLTDAMASRVLGG